MLLTIFSRGLEHQELFTKIFNSSFGNVLLIQNGVYFGIEMAKPIKNIFALEEDVIARGLINAYPKDIKLINYEQFVDLIIKYPKNITY